MSFKSIIGQPLAVELAQRWLNQETTQPLLLYGPAGVGKRLLALELAKALSCTAQKPGKSRGACDQCASCKKIQKGQHVDVRVLDMAYQAAVRDEPLEKQQALRIETVLEERKRLFHSAIEGGWKVSLVDDAQRLTADAANVLLKILEEPPPRTAIFLITPFRDRLFATLVSRCQPIRFRPLNDNEMQQVLSTHPIPAGERMRFIELAQGSPGRALHLNREEEIKAALDADALWQKLPGQRLSQIVSRGPMKTRLTRGEVETMLSHLLQPAVRELRGPHHAAAGSITLIQTAQRQLRQNAVPSLVLDNLLLQLSRTRKPS